MILVLFTDELTYIATFSGVEYSNLLPNRIESITRWPLCTCYSPVSPVLYTVTLLKCKSHRYTK